MLVTEFNIPKGWVVTTIEDLLENQVDGKLIHQGWSPQCDKEPALANQWGVLKTTAIQDGYFLQDENKRLPEGKEPKPRIEVKEGDVLITNAGPRARCGVICFVKTTKSKLMLSGKMYRLRFPMNHVDPKFIELWLRTAYVQYQLNIRKTGINESGLNMTQARFLTLPMILVPIFEQKLMVQKLEQLLLEQKKIKSTLERVIENITKFRQSTLNFAVMGKLSESFETTQNCYFDSLNREIKKSKKLSKIKNVQQAEFDMAVDLFGSNFKQGWRVFALEQLVDETRGIPYGIVQTGDAQDSGVPTIRGGDVKRLSIDASNLKMVKPEIESKYLRTRLQGGEVILAIRGTVGNASVVDKKLAEKPLNISREVAMIPVREGISSKYIAILLLSTGGFKFLAEKTRGVAQRGINLADIKRFVTPLPPIDEQIEIVSQVDSLFDAADEIEKQAHDALERSNQMTYSILAKAFCGELTADWRAQNPDLITGDNSAEALLAKIQEERAKQKPNKRTRTKAKR